MVATFTTEVVPEHERAEYWQEIAGKMFLGLRTERRDWRPFFGTLESRTVGSVAVTFLHSSAQRVFRGAPEIARSPANCFYLAMQLSGTCRLTQAGRVHDAHPGDIEFLDSTQPGAIAFDTDYRRIVISIPYDDLRPRLVDIDRTVGDVARGHLGMGALASTYFRSFATTQLPDVASAPAADILVDLLALTFNAPRAGLDSNAPCMREARRVAIRQWVERRLDDPSLSPARIAARFKMSPRYLHGLFADQGVTVMRWVRSRRLARARAMLIDPSLRRRTILEVAIAAGFQDQSHFGRAFKAAFEMSPRTWRAIHRPNAEA